jgi:hypothetical protein
VFKISGESGFAWSFLFAVPACLLPALLCCNRLSSLAFPVCPFHVFRASLLSVLPYQSYPIYATCLSVVYRLPDSPSLTFITQIYGIIWYYVMHSNKYLTVVMQA